MRKKVILIGGTSYSGSTMLDLMLGNDPKGFSTGEYRGFLMPRFKRHFETNFVSEEAERLWKKVKQNSISNLYKTIFNQYPAIEFIIDSSKNPFFLKEMEQYASKMGYEVKHLLLWKKPEDFAYSCYKRNKLNNWDNNWKRYYRTYVSLFSDYTIVSYSDIVNKADYLKKLCEKIDIPFFNDKYKYWQKESFALGGNRRAKIHMHNADSKEYLEIRSSLKSDAIEKDDKNSGKHQTIYYEQNEEFLENKNIRSIIQRDKQMVLIWDALEENNLKQISESSSFYRQIRYKKLFLKYINIKSRTRFILLRLKGFVRYRFFRE